MTLDRFAVGSRHVPARTVVSPAISKGASPRLEASALPDTDISRRHPDHPRLVAVAVDPGLDGLYRPDPHPGSLWRRPPGAPAGPRVERRLDRARKSRARGVGAAGAAGFIVASSSERPWRRDAKGSFMIPLTDEEVAERWPLWQA